MKVEKIAGRYKISVSEEDRDLDIPGINKVIDFTKYLDFVHNQLDPDMEFSEQMEACKAFLDQLESNQEYRDRKKKDANKGNQ